MATNVRGTMLCYKHAAKQMIAQGRGGRIIGAFLLSPPFFVPTSISRGLFKSRKTGLSLLLVLHRDEAHLASTGFNVTLSYSASKFAVRGLTQASGTLFLRNKCYTVLIS
jgi:NAD(P)-dependent dehydrogenase (short-subunit alcohol dehydrogenase family)